MYIARDILPPGRDTLHVIAVISNPVRYKIRIKHYSRFAKYVVDSGATLHTVEAAFGDREHALTEIAPHDPCGRGHQYIKLRTVDELWQKESMINIGISRLPSDWKYVAWIDADVRFARQNWVWETMHQLQHWAIVQMWSDAIDLGPLYIPIQSHKSFMWCYHHNVPMPKSFETSGGYYPVSKTKKELGQPNLFHPGFAWSATREAIDALGGLIDFAICGAGDNHVARALIGKVEDSVHPKIHPRYRERLQEYQWKAEQFIRRKVGYVSGLLLHDYHGAKVNRNYYRRWAILVEQQFNPDTDISYDSQGLVQLVDRGDERTRILRDRLMRYNRARSEDSTAISGTEQNEWDLG